MPQPKPLSTASDKFLLSPDKPSWDTSPISRGPWYFSLEDYLPTVDGRFSTLLRKGYVLTKGKVCVTSVHHLAIVKAALDNRQAFYHRLRVYVQQRRHLMGLDKASLSVSLFVRGRDHGCFRG